MKIRLIGTAVIAVLVTAGFWCYFGRGVGAKVAVATAAIGAEEGGATMRLSAVSPHIEEILALAKKSAEKDYNVNFYGFFTGMSRYDAMDLAAHYELKEGEYSFSAGPGKAVSRLWFSLQGVRRITKGGNTLDALAQAVASRVGDLKKVDETREYELKTIDGVVVRMGEEGLSIQNDKLASQKPIVTKVHEQKEADAPKMIQSIIGNMVSIPGKGFKLGKYEVTQAQWQAVMGNNPLPSYASDCKNPDNPVAYVSWNDCKKFLEELNVIPEVKSSGLTFRLPAEAEWEYACRAGGTGDYCRLADGTEITTNTLGKVAWYGDNSGGKTHPVGQKEPNAFGLYDMHGNVWEWCEDLYQAGGSLRVSRGGGWLSDSRFCAAGYRSSDGPDGRNDSLGFRLAAAQDVNR